MATIREPLVVLDQDLLVRSVNSAFCRTFEVDADTILGHRLYDLGNGQWDIPGLRELLERIIPAHEFFEAFEVTHDFPSIGTRTMLLNARRIPGSNGAGKLILLAIEDVTKQRRAEGLLAEHARDLARSNDELEQFAYVASHDLREPLRMVASYGDLLGTRYGDKLDERGSKYIKYMVEGAERMQQLIEDLLTYARAAREAEIVTNASAQESLDRALGALDVAIEESGATVTHDSLPAVTGHTSELQQVFQNLIANSIKFRGDDHPQIHVSATRRGDKWQFSVNDNGIGIDPVYGGRIFGLFQRLHSRASYAGSGVGLALCKKIIEARGGTIWVESTPGKGATFWFTVPAQLEA